MGKRIWLDVGCAHKSKGEKSFWFPKSTAFRNMLGGANAKQKKPNCVVGQYMSPNLQHAKYENFFSS
jgi:hypothetical protein